VSRSVKEQRRALEHYKGKLRTGQRGGEGYMDAYKRHAKDYQDKVWKEANRKKEAK